MSRYKDHRGSKRRGYDEDYTPDYHAADRQPEYFSPRPTLTQGSEPVEASVKWFNADKGFGFCHCDRLGRCIPARASVRDGGP